MRSPLCFWAARQLGLSLKKRARHLEMAAPRIGYAVCRGKRLPERITRDC